jgi:hypothetical protein
VRRGWVIGTDLRTVTSQRQSHAESEAVAEKWHGFPRQERIFGAHNVALWFKRFRHGWAQGLAGPISVLALYWR